MKVSLLQSLKKSKKIIKTALLEVILILIIPLKLGGVNIVISSWELHRFESSRF